ncbi:hypothetical protein KHA80_14530 [Anaerobacillus sp. HL2]|nr:hypothetical protein KHA80_14530 [Anaerobacillus sp. HL2]
MSFALNPDLTESIIGSKVTASSSITRADYTTPAGTFKAHETDLYIKFKELENNRGRSHRANIRHPEVVLMKKGDIVFVFVLILCFWLLRFFDKGNSVM